MKVDIIKSFKQNHEVWLALNHYLPPELLFELFSVIARNLNTDFPINKLFDSNTKSKTIGVKRNFFPKEIKKNNPVQKELRSLLLTILHNRDDFSEVGLEDRKSEVNKFIQICRLGATDFIAFKEYLDFSNYIVTSNFEKFLKIFQYHSSNYNKKPNIHKYLDFADPVINVIVLKYISDLYVDVDEWKIAFKGYQKAKEKLSELEFGKYFYLKEMWNDILDSSIGSCIRVIQGKEKARLYYEDLLNNKSLKKNETFFINSKFDILNTYTFETMGNSNYFDLMKMTALENPLFSGYGVGSSGISIWLSGNHEYAYRVFWADIRRSIARGDFTETNVDKFWYGVSLLEQAFKYNNSKSLEGALNLILESGQYDRTNKINWDKYAKLFKERLTAEIIETLSVSSKKYQGVQNSRTLTFIEIIEKLIRFSSREITNLLFDQLINIGLSGSISVYQGDDLTGRVIKSLLELSKTNLDLSEKIDSLFTLFKEQFTPKKNVKMWWRQQHDPLRLINKYITYLSEEKKEKTIELVLIHFDFENAPDRFVKEQILSLLTDSALKNVYKNNSKLKEQVKEIVINSAKGEDPDSFMIFIYRFDEGLVFDNRIKENFLKIKSELLEHLKENSTRTESVIKSLIFGLHLLDNLEMDKFFNGLKSILRVRDDGRRHMIFPYAYEHVNHLRYIYKKLDLEQWQREKIKNELIQISEIYKANWKYAIGEKEKDKEFELIFTEFSIPSRLKINETIVFNWAFSSVYLANFLQDIDWLFDILRELKAKKRDSYNPYLKALVRELAFLKDKATLITDNLIEMIKEFDDSDQFYTSVPSLIANLSSFNSVNSKQVLEELAKKIFTYGPNKNDTGVLIELLRSNDANVDFEKFKNYKQRLMNTKEEYELIYPYYAALEFKYKLIEEET
ncbi:MAG: hypothetical protein KBA66_04645 [Leptospiraceae bacterium]|nr:hypothetical protein [Leptospiraceae bacterium]